MYIIFTDVDVHLTYVRDNTYLITIDDKTYNVYAILDTVDNKSILHSVVDGVHSKANVVLNGDTVHLFTVVRY